MAEGFFATPLVAAELDMTEEQEQKWKELNVRLREHMSRYTSTLSPVLPRGGATEEKKEALRKKLLEEMDTVSEFLLPHQQKRLSQLALRYKLRLTRGRDYYPELQALVDQDDAIDIKLSGKARDELEEKMEGFEEELRAMFERHRNEVRALAEKHEVEALDLLSPKQQEKFLRLLGPNLNFREGVSKMPRR